MNNLELIRKKSGLSRRELAKKLNITEQSVSQQEKRGIQSTKTARQYANIFGCDWRLLFDN